MGTSRASAASSRRRRASLSPRIAGEFASVIVRRSPSWAGVAQSVEQRFCKPQVMGSSPLASSKAGARWGPGTDPFHPIASALSSLAASAWQRRFENESPAATPTTIRSSDSERKGDGSPRAHFHPPEPRNRRRSAGEVPKRPNGADCKSAGSRLRRFESSPLHHGVSTVESTAEKLGAIHQSQHPSAGRASTSSSSTRRFRGRE